MRFGIPVLIDDCPLLNFMIQSYQPPLGAENFCDNAFSGWGEMGLLRGWHLEA
jgi:hypothetical protein